MAQIQTKFLANDSVTNAKLAAMATLTLKGNNTGGSSQPLDLTVSQVQSMLSIPTSSSPLSLAAGGTGISAGSANAAFNALSPLTTKGDLLAFSTVNARVAVGANGTFLMADSSAATGVSWQAVTDTGVTTIGEIDSQTSNADGLLIVGTTLYAQFGNDLNAGMVSIPGESAIVISFGAIDVKVDGSTILKKVADESYQLEAIQPAEQRITLSPTDITNQYVDLSFPIFGSSASANSATLWAVGGPMQLKTVDYTVSLTGGAAGVTRITFAGDLATGGSAALISGDILVINYSYLA